jgi:hypothetical protein
MPVPAHTITTDLNPSEMLLERAFPTIWVSAESLLTNSPVDLLSNQPCSCLMIVEKTRVRNACVILKPEFLH